MEIVHFRHVKMQVWNSELGTDCFLSQCIRVIQISLASEMWL